MAAARQCGATAELGRFKPTAGIQLPFLTHAAAHPNGNAPKRAPGLSIR